MLYSIHPKAHRLEHEISTLRRHMRYSLQRTDMNDSVILDHYREMIRFRQELVSMYKSQQKRLFKSA